MTQGRLVIGIILLALMQLVACEGNVVDSPKPADRIGTSQLEGIFVAQTTIVQEGEPVLFALENRLSPLEFQWKISPNQNIRVEKTKTVANIYFPQSGKYTVTVLDSISQDSVSLIVDVIIYEPGYDNIAILQHFDADDILSLTPITFPDSTFHLEFLTETKNTYKCNNNYMLISRDKVQDTFVYDFLRVISPAGCNTEKAKSKLYVYTNEPIKDGKTYNLEITFNGKNYKGSFVRNGGNYQFTWPYDNGVIFTKKTL